MLSPLLNPFLHTTSLLAISLMSLNTGISGHITRSPYITGLSNTLLAASVLISPLSTQCQSLAAQYVQCVIVVALCIPPPSSSLANKASDPRLCEAAPAPGLSTEAAPVSPRSLAIFQDLSPVTSYTCKYNGLGDY